MILIKVGGGKEINWEWISRDIAEISKKEQVIIVHGASGTRNDIAEKMGAKRILITSPSGVQSTFTDQEAIDIFLMAYAGLINKKAVASLLCAGVNAVGLSGVDGKLWEAKWKKDLMISANGKVKLLKGSFTGRVESINIHLIQTLMNANYVPVICPPAISHEGIIVNTDNDTTCALMAKELNIKTMIMLFEAPGFLRDYKKESSLVPHIKKEELSSYLDYAKGTMKKKVLGAQKAFEGGVEKIYWGDGRVKNPILQLLLGKGTIIS